MNGQVLDSRKWTDEADRDVLDVLSQSDSPALATDATGHVIFWNHAAELLLGRGGRQVMGRRCYDVVCGRDVFGNRFCHESCTVLSMSRKGETVRPFEMMLGSGAPKSEQPVHVSVLKVPGEQADSYTLVHVLQPIDRAARLARALEQLGPPRTEPAESNGNHRAHGAVEPPSASSDAPPLTEREKEILRSVAQGLPNKEIARQLGISLATVRNHVHNILEKLEVHSKLEATSLAFRQGWVSAPRR
jgi:DNA-binding CsgD family transcriptional regulator